MNKRHLLFALFLFMGMMVMGAKPKVWVLATGGTIAGQGTSASETHYEPGKIGVQTLLNAVPEIFDLADIKGEQVENMGSQDLTDAVWLRLAKRVNELLAKDDVDGIVITHGTDTMEETAYFLNLTVKSEKPVVLVGAMRPATSLSADGPMNMLQAVAVASSKEAVGKGAMIVMNGQVLDARSAMKTNTQSVESFQAPFMGMLGYTEGTKVFFLRESKYRHTARSKFDVMKRSTLPKVGIIYAHANMDADMLTPILNNRYEGVVIAGVGNGNFNKALYPVLMKAREKGIAVVRSSRIPTGSVSMTGEVDDKKYGFVASLELTPQKARVLLQLALTQTKDFQQIQKWFMEY